MYEIPVFKIKVFKDRTQTVEEKKITHPQMAARAFRSVMGELDREYLVVMCLNKQNDFLGMNTVAMGTIDEVPADRGFVANIVTSVRGTAGWIIIHNHLSGDPEPSPEDRVLFRNMIKLGDNIDRPLIDAIIIASGSDKFYSHKTSAPYDFIIRD